jgi:dihydroneopterin aldolase
MSDFLRIVDLELHTRIGVTPDERESPQLVLVSVTMEVDARAAAASDDVRKTIDYSAVARLIAELAKIERQTIERFAEDVASAVLERHRPLSITVTVKKFVLPGIREASITITRP